MRYDFACVIPFFQKESGLLLKAVNSILSQEGPVSYLIVIVDDSSPVNAEDELSKIGEEHKEKIKIISQINQGAAIARNTAIEYAVDKADYIAFLDSDDVWSKHHLRNAKLSFDAGADLYFSDIKTLEASVSKFSDNRYPIENHIKFSEDIYVHSGDIIAEFLQYNMMSTPTIVYRVDMARDLRFQTKFRFAGEDHLFWMRLALCSRKTLFSVSKEAVCGVGVNIFSSIEWGSDCSILKIYRELLYRKEIPLQFSLSKEQNDIVQYHINRLRMQFAQMVVHKIVNRKAMELKVWRSLLVLDPAIFLLLPLNIFRYFYEVSFKVAKK